MPGTVNLPEDRLSTVEPARLDHVVFVVVPRYMQGKVWSWFSNEHPSH